MGFAILAAQIIIMTVFVMAIGVFILSQQQTAESYAAPTTVTQPPGTMQTLDAVHNSTQNQTVISFVYQGQATFPVQEVDVYVNNERLPRQHQNVTKTIIVDLANPNLVDSADTVRILHTAQFMQPPTYIITAPDGATKEIVPQVVS